MAPRPIFAVTHPRAVSTAFERVFMTRRDIIQSVHEPFGDAYYYGPEFRSERFKDEPESREASGFSATTYGDVVSKIEHAGKEGKRVFIKDMAYYLFNKSGEPGQIAASLGGGAERGNPTALPLEVLEQFHFTFLIRHPRRSIPSYYRCVIPPLSEITGFTHFMPSEAGYEELVRLFDFLIDAGIVDKKQLTVIDADSMLDHPEETVKVYCEKTGIDFRPEMLDWSEKDKEHAGQLFAKWNGFHDDALDTDGLKARTHAQKTSTVELEDEEWAAAYGPEAAKEIRETVDANIPYYDYLNQFTLKI